MTDFKHYGLHHRRDQRLDDIATGIAWAVAIILLLLYVPGMMP